MSEALNFQASSYPNNREIACRKWPECAGQGPQAIAYRPIPFENVLTILVSVASCYVMREKGERVCTLGEGRKGGGKLLIQTESVYMYVKQTYNRDNHQNAFA